MGKKKVAQKKVAIKKAKKAGYVQPEMKKIMDAIGEYMDVNEGCVHFVGSFIAYDVDKIEAKEKDIFIDGSDRIFAYGEKGCLKIALSELQKTVEKNADEDGFVCY